MKVLILLGLLLLNLGVDSCRYRCYATVSLSKKERHESTGFGKTEYYAREEAKRNARITNNDKPIRVIKHTETKLGDDQYTSVVIWESE